MVWDRKPFPRDKICAGWITPQVAASLELDLDSGQIGIPEGNRIEAGRNQAGGKDDKRHLDTSLLELAAPELARLDPARARMVRTALRQLQTLREERVCLMSPPFLVP